MIIETFTPDIPPGFSLFAYLSGLQFPSEGALEPPLTPPREGDKNTFAL